MCCVNISAGPGGLGSLPYFSVFSVAALPTALCGSVRRAECGIMPQCELSWLRKAALAANPSFKNCISGMGGGVTSEALIETENYVYPFFVCVFLYVFSIKQFSKC